MNASLVSMIATPMQPVLTRKKDTAVNATLVIPMHLKAPTELIANRMATGHHFVLRLLKTDSLMPSDQVFKTKKKEPSNGQSCHPIMAVLSNHGTEITLDTLNYLILLSKRIKNYTKVQIQKTTIL